MTVDQAVVGLGVGTGAAMGVLTSLVGLPPSIEPFVWLLFYGLWLWAMHRRDSPSPFATVVLASVCSGVAVGLVQAALMPQYVAANPWYAEHMSGSQVSLGGQMLVQGIGMGVLFGIAVGLLARGLAKRRSAE